MAEIISAAMDITPEMAKKALANRARNRPLKPAAITRYADDMRNGRWRGLNGETVSFNTEGQLTDGQNRMAAIIEADVTVQMLVVNGVDQADMITINTGVGRSFGDYLSIGKGIKNAQMTAAVVARMYRWDVLHEYAVSHSRVLSHQALDAYLTEHENEILPAIVSSDQGREIMAPSTLVTCRILLNRVDKDAARVFLEQLVNGIGITDPDSPVIILRHRLERDRLAAAWAGPAKSKAWNPEIARALTFIAWNAWRQGRIITKLQLPKSGLEIRYPFPQ